MREGEREGGREGGSSGWRGAWERNLSEFDVVGRLIVHPGTDAHVELSLNHLGFGFRVSGLGFRV